MRKLYLLVLIWVLTVSISFPILAEDYSNIKGDFMVLCLKDSPSVIKTKIQYLKDNDSISQVSSDGTFFVGTLLDADYGCTVDFINNKAFSFYIQFIDGYKASDIDKSLKNFVYRIETVFKKKYGDPMIFNGYPSISKIREGYPYIYESWLINGKVTAVSINQSKYLFYPSILIADKELMDMEGETDKNKEESEIKKAEEVF